MSSYDYLLHAPSLLSMPPLPGMKKRWGEMTPEEQQLERIKYAMGYYGATPFPEDTPELSKLPDNLQRKFDSMTPEDQEMERVKYALSAYQMNLGKNYSKGGNVARSTPGIGALPARYIDGKGDGMSDSVPAVISNKQPARLADGEFVIPADVVSHLGNGSSKAGARQLYSMMDRVRRARTGNPRQGRQIKPAKHMPA